VILTDRYDLTPPAEIEEAIAFAKGQALEPRPGLLGRAESDLGHAVAIDV
jgi:hypothetical protein